MNEAHSGLARCVRTREVGRALLPVAHALGVRDLAMEALWPAVTASANANRRLDGDLWGYLGQPEMGALVNAALGLGWTLHAYEADVEVMRQRAGPETPADVNWREDQQARNLGAVLGRLARSENVLAWCGNGHLGRRVLERSEGEPAWTPMGSLVAGYCGVEPFAIDQTATVAFEGRDLGWLDAYAEALLARGGTAGVLAEDIPAEVAWRKGHADAYVLSLDNALVE